jgi:hypothetical protein
VTAWVSRRLPPTETYICSHPRAKEPVLQTLPIKPVTSVNATGTPRLRMYWHTTSLGTTEYPDLPDRSNRTSLGYEPYDTVFTPVHLRSGT